MFPVHKPLVSFTAPQILLQHMNGAYMDGEDMFLWRHRKCLWVGKMSGCRQHKGSVHCLPVFPGSQTNATTANNFPVFFSLAPLSQQEQNAPLGIELIKLWFGIYWGESGENFLLDLVNAHWALCVPPSLCPGAGEELMHITGLCAWSKSSRLPGQSSALAGTPTGWPRRHRRQQLALSCCMLGSALFQRGGKNMPLQVFPVGKFYNFL